MIMMVVINNNNNSNSNLLCSIYISEVILLRYWDSRRKCVVYNCIQMLVQPIDYDKACTRSENIIYKLNKVETFDSFQEVIVCT